MCISKGRSIAIRFEKTKLQKHSTWPDYFLSMGVPKYAGNMNQKISIQMWNRNQKI